MLGLLDLTVRLEQMFVACLTVPKTVFSYSIALSALLATIVLRFLYIVYQNFHRRWRAELELAEFPSPDRHWFYGHLHILKDEGSTLLDQSAKSSPISVIWLGPFLPRVILNHPVTIKALLTTTEPKDDLTYGMVKDWLGDGLLISTGEKWFRNRRLLTPGFHFHILVPYVKIYNECMQTMLDKWSNLCRDDPGGTRVLEMFDNISLMTLDTLLKSIFSQESNCQLDRNQNPYIRGVHTLSYLVPERVRFLPYHSDFIFHLTPMGYKFRQALQTVHGYTKRVIQERKQALIDEGAKMRKEERKYVDFLDILLRARDEDNRGLSDQEIQDEVDTFMFGGHDTTASGISWCLYNLANHPEHQQKCREEIDEVLDGKEKAEIQWEDLSRLSYTTMCINESLRTHPPAPMIARRLTSPLVLQDGRIVPAGYSCTATILGMHHNPEVWPEPSRYDPLRFLPENTIDRLPYAFVPFSAGPRNCIGKNFAMNEMKVAIARILHKFELFPVKDRLPQRMNNMVLRSSNGIHLQVRPRTL